MNVRLEGPVVNPSSHASPNRLEGTAAPAWCSRVVLLLGADVRSTDDVTSHSKDWAIHRGAAVFVENSINITVEGLTFDQVSGNAIMFSNAVKDSAIRKCTFNAVGDSAIAMLGSTQLMLGTKGKGLLPTNNVVEQNIVDTVGVYGKQTSAYFKAKADSNIVRNNIFMNGPRAGKCSSITS